MALFAWSDDYSVAVPEIDRQHRRLFEYAARLHAAMLAGKAKEVLAPILENLISYTRSHFATEEELMRRHRYPAYAAHKSEHDALTQKVLALQSEFEFGRAALTLELMDFLKQWLARHILGTDRLLGAHLASP